MPGPMLEATQRARARASGAAGRDGCQPVRSRPRGSLLGLRPSYQRRISGAHVNFDIASVGTRGRLAVDDDPAASAVPECDGVVVCRVALRHLVALQPRLGSRQTSRFRVRKNVQSLPRRGLVAGGAVLAEGPLVAVVTGVASDARRRRADVSAVRMAGRTGGLGVPAREGEPRLGVVERDVVPAGGRVAGGAVTGELPVVRVVDRVAAAAGRGPIPVQRRSTWQDTQSASTCCPTSGKRVRSWSMVASVQVAGVWHSAHEVPSRPSWMSSAAWQATHSVSVARSASRVVDPWWQAPHGASSCPPVRGYVAWSNAAP